ncbi:ATP synthase subunit I [Psychrobium sp. MM17-31]|uniref:ATP synthase subunit I n=1 Tax=Psychrobium sp. MM17-31 TaxID=2917758 RepID=UPI001EF53F55|nr:ATP synthase subunit I [Psychrobium sp. MM17-31]MCG7532825.1 ATP synthase subunit I [Psychrobium sp. MM17-31]
MVKKLASKGRSTAYKLIGLQTVAVLLASLIFFLTNGKMAAVSALCGGLISIFPNFVFATLAFRNAGASASREILSDFFKGEALKLVLVIVLFWVVFKTLDVIYLPLFVTYALAIVLHWLSPLIFKSKKVG